MNSVTNVRNYFQLVFEENVNFKTFLTECETLFTVFKQPFSRITCKSNYLLFIKTI